MLTGIGIVLVILVAIYWGYAFFDNAKHVK